MASMLAISSYADASVANGKTYHYVATATDTASNESGYCGRVSVGTRGPSAG